MSSSNQGLSKFSTEPTKIGHIFRKYLKNQKCQNNSLIKVGFLQRKRLKDSSDFQHWEVTENKNFAIFWEVAGRSDNDMT